MTPPVDPGTNWGEALLLSALDGQLTWSVPLTAVVTYDG